MSDPGESSPARGAQTAARRRGVPQHGPLGRGLRGHRRRPRSVVGRASFTRRRRSCWSAWCWAWSRRRGERGQADPHVSVGGSARMNLLDGLSGLQGNALAKVLRRTVVSAIIVGAGRRPVVTAALGALGGARAGHRARHGGREPAFPRRRGGQAAPRGRGQQQGAAPSHGHQERHSASGSSRVDLRRPDAAQRRARASAPLVASSSSSCSSW